MFSYSFILLWNSLRRRSSPIVYCCTPAAKGLGLGPAYVNTWRVTGSGEIGCFCSFTLLRETVPHLITEKYTSHDRFCLVQPKHTSRECEVLEGWGHIPIKQMLKRKKLPLPRPWESKIISIQIASKDALHNHWVKSVQKLVTVPKHNRKYFLRVHL